MKTAPHPSSRPESPWRQALIASVLALCAACSSEAVDTDPAPTCGPGFATAVVSATYGANAGFGQTSMPSVVLGPPKGAGTLAGSTDVVSLGAGGEIVVSFSGSGIEDGPGADFIVFENAFFAGGDSALPFAEPGEVSVSDDGIAWRTFPCDADVSPFEGCAGTHPVLSSLENGVPALDPALSGGDAFDLAQVGLARVRFVRIRDAGNAAAPPSAGFDLDAVGVIHASCP